MVHRLCHDEFRTWNCTRAKTVQLHLFNSCRDDSKAFVANTPGLQVTISGQWHTAFLCFYQLLDAQRQGASYDKDVEKHSKTVFASHVCWAATSGTVTRNVHKRRSMGVQCRSIMHVMDDVSTDHLPLQLLCHFEAWRCETTDRSMEFAEIRAKQISSEKSPLQFPPAQWDLYQVSEPSIPHLH